MRRVADLGRGAGISLGVAVTWSVVLVLAAFTVPVYSGESASSDGVTTTDTATLVGENGLGVLVVVATPLVLTLLVAGCLAFVPWPRGRTLGWVVTALMGALNLLAMLTVGLFMLPVTLALVIACATSHDPTHPSRDHAEVVDQHPTAPA